MSRKKQTPKIVRLDVGRTFARIGYPLGLREAEAEIGPEKLASAVQALLVATGAADATSAAKPSAIETLLKPPTDARVKLTHKPKWLRDLVDSVCYVYARKRHFGGDERRVHYHEREDLKGSTFTVVDAKIVVEGTRDGGSRGSARCGYDDAEQPSLYNRKRVTLYLAYAQQDAAGCSYLTTSDDAVWLDSRDCAVVD